jgi:hypothetical protein
MKKLLLTLLTIVSLVINFSCSKNDEPGKPADNEPMQTSEFIKLKCQGVEYNFTNPEILNSQIKTLVSFTTNEKRISIFLPLNVAPGTYSITDSPSNLNSYGISLAINAINLDSYATSGSMNITSVTSNNVKGTFSCSIPGTTNPFIVTEGSFNVGN